MFLLGDPLSAFNDLVALTQINLGIALNSSEVVMARNTQMLNGTMTVPEATQMVMEKPETFAKSLQAAAGALLVGQTPAQVMEAALNPVRQQTRDNALRLRRG